MATIGTICARGGSQGLERKNLKPLLGKPLIVHTIEQALACGQIDTVYVSTDDEEIMAVAKQAGAQVPFKRPHELATNAAAKHPAILHCISWVRDSGIEVDRVVDLDPTSPLRDMEDIHACLELLDDKTDAVFSVYESDKNPYFNMVELTDDRIAAISKKPEQPVVARQQAPKVYVINASIYAWHGHTLDKGLWGGRTKAHIMPRSRSVDIDDAIDFALVELLLKQRADFAATNTQAPR